MTSAGYVGRFAPSPTGLLHFGSLLAAMASYCDARSRNGIWQFRIDDIDPPRAIPDAAEHFKQTLHTYGFNWDCPIKFQSERSETYRRRLLELNKNFKLYLCSCSRRDLSGYSTYPNTCKPASITTESRIKAADDVTTKLANAEIPKSVRVIMDGNVVFTDLIQGEQTVDMEKHIGDTVVVRRDNLFAYALACAIDDADGITRVVRGADLLPTTATQIRIMELLGLKAPQYAHIPVAMNSHNQKLSKQTHAKSIDAMAPLPTLQRAWRALGQKAIDVHNVASFWQAAIPAWNLQLIPKKMSTCHE